MTADEALIRLIVRDELACAELDRALVRAESRNFDPVSRMREDQPRNIRRAHNLKQLDEWLHSHSDAPEYGRHGTGEDHTRFYFDLHVTIDMKNDTDAALAVANRLRELVEIDRHVAEVRVSSLSSDSPA